VVNAGPKSDTGSEETCLIWHVLLGGLFLFNKHLMRYSPHSITPLRTEEILLATCTKRLGQLSESMHNYV
jgi:hypothetical protein